MPVAVFGGRFWPLPATAFTPLVVSVLALGTDDGAVADRAGLAPARAHLLLPGLGLQRLTTREPELAETRVALTARGVGAPPRTRPPVACGA